MGFQSRLITAGTSCVLAMLLGVLVAPQAVAADPQAAVSAVEALPDLKAPDEVKPEAEPAPATPQSGEAPSAASDYAFSNASGVVLEDMSTGTTQLVAASLDDTASAVTNIGFDFWLEGIRHTQFSVNANGLARLGSVAVGTPFDNATGFAVTTNEPKLAPFFDDLCTGANGRVHYRVVGTAPTRRLVVEWQNMQITRGPGGCAGLGGGTFQLWLNESTGVIQFVYGAGMTGSLDGGYTVGLQAGLATNFASVTTATNTVSTAVHNSTQTTAITSGTAYSFSPPVPLAPTGLSFTAVSAIGMTLNWTDNATNEVGYVIYQSTDGINYTFATQTAAGATSQVVSGLTPSTNYFFRVQAVTQGALSAALSGSQATGALGNVSSTAAGGLWSATTTWVGGVVPTASDNVTIVSGSTVTIDTAALAYSLTVDGSLLWEAIAARTLAVSTSVTISATGSFQSAASGTVTTHSLSVVNALTNNGVLDFSTNADTAGASIAFSGASSDSFGGSGATTDLRALTVAKGARTNVLTLNPSNLSVRGVNTDAAGFLTLTSGTLRIAGTYTVTNRVFATVTYVIPPTGGIWLDNPNFIVAGQAAGTTTNNNGLFRVSQGVYNIGVGAADGMGTSVAGSEFRIEGGTVNASGRIDPQSATTYLQSGGTVNVAVIGNSRSNFGSFELFAATSSFTMSGGTINIINRSTGATQVDYRMSAALANINITGGLVIFGATGAPASTTYIVRNSSSIPSFTVNPTMTLNVLTTVAAPGSTALFMRGTALTNNGTITTTTTSTGLSRIDFASANGAMTYSGSGVFGTPTTPATSINANSTFQTTLNAPIIVNRVNLFTGGFINSNQITLGNAGTSTTVVQIGSAGLTTPGGNFDVSPVHNQGTGGQVVLYVFETAPRVTGPEINPTRILTQLIVDNPNGVTIAGGDLSLSATATALTLTNGIVATGSNTLALNVGTATVTRTNGYVNGNFRKAYAAAGSKTFEVGTANGYSPVLVNATAGTFPGVFTARANQAAAPNIFPPGDAITRHWVLTSADVTSADLTFTYLDPADIPGTVVEADLRVFRRDGGVFTNLGGTITPAANTGAVTAVTTFGLFTLAEPGVSVVEPTDLAITKTNGVTNVTPGANTTYTIVASNPTGPSPITGATVADTFPAALTCTWTCAGAGGGTCAASGNGNINDSTVNLPVGGSVTYTAVCAIAGSATGTLVNTATVALPAGVTDPVPGNNSATDTDTIDTVADLSITKTNGVTTVNPGGASVYTITASNAGPSAITGATVTDNFPASLLSCTWTCVGAGGGTCPANGAGNIGATVNLPAGGSATFTASCTVSGSASGSIANTATIAVPLGAIDPVPGNNSATDTDTVQQVADVELTVLNDRNFVQIGETLVYNVVAENQGPNAAPSVAIAGTLPPELSFVSWSCFGVAGGTCGAPNGVGSFTTTANLPAGGTVIYTVQGVVASEPPSGNIVFSATATVGGGVVDPVPGNNTDSHTAAVVIFRNGFECALGRDCAGGTETLEEGFTDVTTLPGSGWLLQNNSQPLGGTGWFQGGSGGTFPGHMGGQTSYVGANFNNTSGAGTISNWLMTPAITFNNASSLSFWTRAPAGSTFPDRLQVRLCTGTPCNNVGATSASVGDFTTQLLEINAGLTVGGYPEAWTQFTINNAGGLPTSGQGRLAFRYFVTDGGPAGANSDFIGIDTVTIVAQEIGGIGTPNDSGLTRNPAAGSNVQR